jgi:uncharacterized damage-inducible protein DinB
MDALPHHLWTQACNNAWANLRLLRACAALSDAAFAATRTRFFPSIRATLNHNLTVDWFYDEFFCADDATLRGDELVELGLSEAQLWDSVPSRS